MEKIVLNDKQKAVMQKYLDDSYSPFFSSEEDQLAMHEVINMADALMLELDAVEEAGEDLMRWFWGKYQEQENTK